MDGVSTFTLYRLWAFPVAHLRPAAVKFSLNKPIYFIGNNLFQFHLFPSSQEAGNLFPASGIDTPEIPSRIFPYLVIYSYPRVT
mgnify:CR=1 FL=1